MASFCYGDEKERKIMKETPLPDLPYDMKVVCAWCGEFIRMAKSVGPDRVSHGICEKCKEQVIAETMAS